MLKLYFKVATIIFLTNLISAPIWSNSYGVIESWSENSSHIISSSVKSSDTKARFVWKATTTTTLNSKTIANYEIISPQNVIAYKSSEIFDTPASGTLVQKSIEILPLFTIFSVEGVYKFKVTINETVNSVNTGVTRVAGCELFIANGQNSFKVNLFYPQHEITLNEPNPFFQWSAIGPGINYTIYLSEFPDPTNHFIFKATTKSNQIFFPLNVKQLEKDKKYFWQIQATNDQNIPVGSPDGKSAVSSFYFGSSVTGEINLSYPENAAKIRRQNLEFRWIHSPEIDNYILEIFAAEAKDQILYSEMISSVKSSLEAKFSPADTALLPQDLNLNWRVLALVKGKKVGQSQLRSFSIEGNSDTEGSLQDLAEGELGLFGYVTDLFNRPLNNPLNEFQVALLRNSQNFSSKTLSLNGSYLIKFAKEMLKPSDQLQLVLLKNQQELLRQQITTNELVSKQKIEIHLVYSEEKYTLTASAVANAQAIPRAKVTLFNDIFASSQFSNDQGKFIFPDLIKGNYKIQIEAFGFETFSEELTIPASANLIFQLNPLPRSSLKFQLETSSQELLKELAVSVFGTNEYGEKISYSLTSDVSGIITIPMLSSGYYTFSCQKPSFNAAPMEKKLKIDAVLLREFSGREINKLIFEQENALVSAQIIDENGNPLQNLLAIINNSFGQPVTQLTTNHQGKINIPLTEGNYTLRISGNKVAENSASFLVVKNKNLDLGKIKISFLKQIIKLKVVNFDKIQKISELKLRLFSAESFIQEYKINSGVLEIQTGDATHFRFEFPAQGNVIAQEYTASATELQKEFEISLKLGNVVILHVFSEISIGEYQPATQAGIYCGEKLLTITDSNGMTQLSLEADPALTNLTMPVEIRKSGYKSAQIEVSANKSAPFQVVLQKNEKSADPSPLLQQLEQISVKLAILRSGYLNDTKTEELENQNEQAAAEIKAVSSQISDNFNILSKNPNSDLQKKYSLQIDQLRNLLLSDSYFVQANSAVKISEILQSRHTLQDEYLTFRKNYEGISQSLSESLKSALAISFENLDEEFKETRGQGILQQDIVTELDNLKKEKAIFLTDKFLAFYISSAKTTGAPGINCSGTAEEKFLCLYEKAKKLITEINLAPDTTEIAGGAANLLRSVADAISKIDFDRSFIESQLTQLINFNPEALALKIKSNNSGSGIDTDLKLLFTNLSCELTGKVNLNADYLSTTVNQTFFISEKLKSCESVKKNPTFTALMNFSRSLSGFLDQLAVKWPEQFLIDTKNFKVSLAPKLQQLYSQLQNLLGQLKTEIRASENSLPGLAELQQLRASIFQANDDLQSDIQQRLKNSSAEAVYAEVLKANFSKETTAYAILKNIGVTTEIDSVYIKTILAANTTDISYEEISKKVDQSIANVKLKTYFIEIAKTLNGALRTAIETIQLAEPGYFNGLYLIWNEKVDPAILKNMLASYAEISFNEAIGSASIILSDKLYLGNKGFEVILENPQLKSQEGKWLVLGQAKLYLTKNEASSIIIDEPLQTLSSLEIVEEGKVKAIGSVTSTDKILLNTSEFILNQVQPDLKQLRVLFSGKFQPNPSSPPQNAEMELKHNGSYWEVSSSNFDLPSSNTSQPKSGSPFNLQPVGIGPAGEKIYQGEIILSSPFNETIKIKITNARLENGKLISFDLADQKPINAKLFGQDLQVAKVQIQSISPLILRMSRVVIHLAQLQTAIEIPQIDVEISENGKIELLAETATNLNDKAISYNSFLGNLQEAQIQSARNELHISGTLSCQDVPGCGLEQGKFIWETDGNLKLEGFEIQIENDGFWGSFDPGLPGDGDLGFHLGDLDLDNLDLGNLNLGDLDLGNLDLGNLNLGNFDLGNLDLGNLDLGNLDLGNLDLSNLDINLGEDIDFSLGQINFDDIQGAAQFCFSKGDKPSCKCIETQADTSGLEKWCARVAIEVDIPVAPFYKIQRLFGVIQQKEGPNGKKQLIFKLEEIPMLKGIEFDSLNSSKLQQYFENKAK